MQKQIVHVFHSAELEAKSPDLTVAIVAVIDRNLPLPKGYKGNKDSIPAVVPVTFKKLAHGNVFDNGAIFSHRPNDAEPVGFLDPKDDGRLVFYAASASGVNGTNVLLEGKSLPAIVLQLFGNKKMPERSDYNAKPAGEKLTVG